MFAIGVTGAVLGIFTFLSSNVDCVVRDRVKSDNERYLDDLGNEQTLEFRQGNRKLIRRNIAINTGFISLLSLFNNVENDTKKNLYIAGAVPLILGGIQTLFLNDKDLMPVTVNLYQLNQSIVSAVTLILDF